MLMQEHWSISGYDMNSKIAAEFTD